MKNPVTLHLDPEAIRGKYVRFLLPSPSSDSTKIASAEGIGVIIVNESDDQGKFMVSILVETSPDHPHGAGLHQGWEFHLDQEAADALRVLQKEEDGVELACILPGLPSEN